MSTKVKQLPISHTIDSSNASFASLVNMGKFVFFINFWPLIYLIYFFEGTFTRFHKMTIL